MSCASPRSCRLLVSTGTRVSRGHSCVPQTRRLVCRTSLMGIFCCPVFGMESIFVAHFSAFVGSLKLLEYQIPHWQCLQMRDQLGSREREREKVPCSMNSLGVESFEYLHVHGRNQQIRHSPRFMGVVCCFLLCRSIFNGLLPTSEFSIGNSAHHAATLQFR